MHARLYLQYFYLLHRSGSRSQEAKKSFTDNENKVLNKKKHSIEADIIEENQLEWFGHLEQKGTNKNA